MVADRRGGDVERLQQVAGAVVQGGRRPDAASAGADHHLHIRATGPGGQGLWRISLDAVDGWALGAAVEEMQDDRGPFARLLGI